MNRFLQGLMVVAAVCSVAWVGGAASEALAAGIAQQGVTSDAGAGGNGNTGNGTSNTNTGSTGGGGGAIDGTAGNGPTDTFDAGTPFGLDGGLSMGFRSSSRSTVVE